MSHNQTLLWKLGSTIPTAFSSDNLELVLRSDFKLFVYKSAVYQNMTVKTICTVPVLSQDPSKLLPHHIVTLILEQHISSTKPH